MNTTNAWTIGLTPMRQRAASNRSHEPKALQFADARAPQARPSAAPAVALPEPSLRLAQDEEWLVVQEGDAWRQVRFHDYGEIYAVPGLYEKIFYDILQCTSPGVIRRSLETALTHAGVRASDLRALDAGAGNGMVGEQLREMGVRKVVGVDIIPEAAMAAKRDRPNVYEEYMVVDLTQLTQDEHRRLREHEFNCLTCVAALGFGDMPAPALATAIGLLSEGGWLAFTIKAEFVADPKKSEFAKFIADATRRGALTICSQQRYVHRLATHGGALEYVCFVARKSGSVRLSR